MIRGKRNLKLRDEVNDLLDGGDVGSLFLGDFAVELLLDGHDELNGVEGVGTKVIDEGGARDDLVGVDAKLRDDDLLNLVLDAEKGRARGGNPLSDEGGVGGEGGGAGEKKGNDSGSEHHFYYFILFW